ncbi:MAG TPA: outer-membrane lipoprotein carrier protein LolA [Rhizomicrobium sp.]
MRRLILALAIAFTAPALGAAAPQRPAEFNPSDTADLDRVSAYLNAIHTMRGSFIQIGPQGQVDQGKFYIMKPGKMRFDYDAPNPTLVISDGISIAVYNTKLNTANRYPLSSTPLDLLLSNTVDLKRSMSVVSVEHQTGELIVNARSTDRRTTGNITIVFSVPNLELRQWTIVDPQGLATTIDLRNVQQGVDLPAAAFQIMHH